MTVSTNDPTGDYIQVDAVDWVPFPEGLCEGNIRWKLLHVSPESGLVGCKQVLEAWNATTA